MSDCERYRWTWNLGLVYLGDGMWADVRPKDVPEFTIERLGAEFEKVWDDNIDKLYEP